jgi:hypothetical protein
MESTLVYWSNVEHTMRLRSGARCTAFSSELKLTRSASPAVISPS